ncbi:MULTISPECIES: DUF6600 domain-containing protein [unclassified Variovorax]|uniref:DUF6600 domain-containing protein n=1 Tax=unclassified Variovorax TaxID=663243 RepID=UPI003F469737
MSQPALSMLYAPRRWLLGLALLCVGLAASAQQDPPGRVARLNLQQGTVSFAPAGEDSWYDAQPNRPITTGDRLWTDRNARAELYIGSAALRLDGQTHVEFSELDDDTARITSNQGNLQLRVRDELVGQRVEVDTGNIAVVIDEPGEYRIASDPAAGTTWVAVASGRVTLYGDSGQSQSLGARQQLTVSGRDLSAVGGAPQQTGGFEAWVAERNRLEDQSVSARYVSREVVGYQQLDNYGDWQSDATYGDVWFPRNVDADWAPYRDGQWVNVAPWGLTWVDAAPWGFAPFHYGRWARVGPRWGWVPGRPNGRPVYSPALVGFVGGGANAGVQIGNGRNGVGWFPLAPGEQWRPGYHASQRYMDQVNRTAIYNRQARNDFYANQQMPGAVTVLPADRFGRGTFGRRDLVRLPDDRFSRGPVAPTPGIAINGFGGGFGRPAAVMPPAAALMARQQQQAQFQQAQQQQLMQQRAAQAAQIQQQQQLQQQQQMEWQRQQGGRQQQEWRQQQDWRAQQDWRQRGEQERWQQQQQQQQLQAQQQQALRQQQEMQQRAAQAQAQQQQQLLQQQQMQQMQLQQQRAAQQQALAQQQMLRQQQEMQLRAAQAQQQVQAQQQAQQNAMRQAQEAQLRALQQQRGIAPQPQPQGQRSDDPRRLWTSPDSR